MLLAGKELQSFTTDHFAYAPVDLRDLHVKRPLVNDFYIEEGGRYVLYRETALPFTEIDRERLLASGVTTLWVSTAVRERVLPPRRLAAVLAVPDEHLPSLTKAGFWYRSAMAIARQAIAGSVSPQSLDGVSDLISLTADYIAHSPTAFPALLSLMNHHYSVYTHSINVAVYALALGRFVGIGDDQELLNLGLGAFLHDVGKIKVPREVLDKSGPLSAEESAIVQRHPGWGKDLLSSADDLAEEVLTVVAQHHERLDGSGYPDGLIGDDLHPFSLIVALTDTFEAMTSHRPYRPAATAYAALSVLKDELVGKLDRWLFRSLVLLIGNPSLACCA